MKKEPLVNRSALVCHSKFSNLPLINRTQFCFFKIQFMYDTCNISLLFSFFCMEFLTFYATLGARHPIQEKYSQSFRHFRIKQINYSMFPVLYSTHVSIETAPVYLNIVHTVNPFSPPITFTNNCI